jgi:hypothetical protein
VSLPDLCTFRIWYLALSIQHSVKRTQHSAFSTPWVSLTYMIYLSPRTPAIKE